MGTVWHAEDTLLKRDVAIKEIALPPAVGAEEREAIRKRVLREARAAAALNHPNAVTVFDVIEEDGKAFIVMERIEGRTLAGIVKEEGPLSDDRVAAIALDVVAALEAAHASGIVHRDVKPANVMITDDGRTKLADFGIASVKDDPKITASGLVLGSPSFMAPEQATHGESGPEADLWGLGATLYYTIEGTPPFEKNGPIATLTAVVGDEHRPMQGQSSLNALVEALLAKEPGDRPSAAQVRRMVTDPSSAPQPVTTTAVSGRPAPTTPLDEATPAPAAQTRVADDEPRTSATERERRPMLCLVGVGLAVLVAVLIAMFLSNRDGTDVAERREGRRQAQAPAADGDESGTTASEEGDAAVPAEWTTYEDPTLGWQISHPSDWDVEIRDEQNTFFHAPNGSYLQVAWTQPPTADTPEEAWESFSEEFGSTHDDYVELGITPTTFQGMDAAALEFTYSEGGAELHAVDLGFITEDGSTGMALYFQTHEEDWESSQPLFEQLKASFQPPE